MKNHRIKPLLLIACFVCAVSRPVMTGAQDGINEDFWFGSSHPKEIREIYQARRQRIEEELSRGGVGEWAGGYHKGDFSMKFAPEAGFVFMLSGCLGVYELDYGSVEWSGDKLKLLPERPDNEFIESVEYAPVRWGGRHYLLAQDEMIPFANAINAGFEPCREDCGNFFLKRGDQDKKARGRPGIPEQYHPYLLKQPIEARIEKIVESRLERDKVLHDYQNRITNVIVDAGSEKGVLLGMELYVYLPKGLFEKARITKVNAASSEAEIFQYNAKEEPPSTDWRLSTRVDLAESEE